MFIGNISRPLDTHKSDMLVKLGDRPIGGGGRGRGLVGKAQPVRGPGEGAEGGGGQGGGGRAAGVDFRVLGEGRKGNEVGVRERGLGPAAQPGAGQEGVGGEGWGGAVGTRDAGGVYGDGGRGMGERGRDVKEGGALGITSGEVGGGRGGGGGGGGGRMLLGDVQVDAAAPDVVCL
jgi:hypothetical protein